MRIFVEIVDGGSMTAAAKRLGRSLATVVRQLAQLEQELNTRLLQRTTRRISLTTEGRVYLDHCRRILADVEEAEAALLDRAAEPRGELRVTAPVLFGTWHVAPSVNSFLQRYPEVLVDLVLNDGVVDLVESSIDVAVRIGALADSSMVAVPVTQLRRVVCASPELLDRVGTPQRPEDLEARPCIHFKPLTDGATWKFHDAKRQLSVHPTTRFACNQALVAAEACAAGLGFSLLLSYQAEPKIQSGELRVVLEDFEPAALPVSLVYPHARLMSSRVRVFIEWMREALTSRTPALR